MAWLMLALVVLAILAVALIAAKRNSLAGAEGIAFPYVKKESLLTAAERSFLGVLEQAVGGQYRIYAQVRLADLIAVKARTQKSIRTSAQNRINSKHADFVLCERDTLQIICAIELDDASHQKEHRKARDGFIEEACKSASLPLARFTAKASYSIHEVRAAIYNLVTPIGEPAHNPVVEPTPHTPQPSQPATDIPPCPKCGEETVLRSVKTGTHAGKKLWGCKNYPICKGYIPQNT